MFLGKGVLKICSKCTGQQPCRSAIWINLLIEIALRHGCSPVNLLHIFRTPFSENTSGGLLLNIPTLKSEKVQGKIGCKSIFRYSYSADFPERVSIFLRNRCFRKFGRVKGKRLYFHGGWTFYSLLVARYFLLVARCTLLFAPYFLLVAFCSLLVIFSSKLLWNKVTVDFTMCNSTDNSQASG